MLQYKRAHFLLIYPPNTAPSQRFRYEQFYKEFRQWGMVLSCSSFYDVATYDSIKQNKDFFLITFRLLKCFLIRFFKVLFIWRYDVVFIQRGAASIGPPIFEWMIKHIFKVPIFYDFDDAIWRDSDLPSKGAFLKRFLKAFGKVPKIIKWSHTVIVGNEYLATYARQYNKNVVVIPTVVDTEEKFVPKIKEIKSPIIIGWTGSYTTLTYLEDLEPVLTELNDELAFRLVVIADKKPKFQKLNYEFIKWSEENETNALQQIDIGIMPLPDDEWTKGKCGFKAIQYMALGKPAVVSGVGVNTEIVQHGLEGFVCSNSAEWKQFLGELISNHDLIKIQGENARKKVESCYSLKMAAGLWNKVLSV